MATRGHIRVFVVDEDPSAATRAGALLEELGYQARTFTDPLKVIAAATEEPCQLALVKLRIPQTEDGERVIEALKKVDWRICVIAMAADPDLETITQMMRAGTNDVLGSPFEQQELIAAVERNCHKLELICGSEEEAARLIGRRIRAERVRRKLTLSYLSECTDLTTSQLSQVELGKYTPTIWMLARIANTLGLRISVLLSGL